ncbi:MAG: helix-turn-helix transcriptional regulator [Tannerellaceae bacterium]
MENIALLKERWFKKEVERLKEEGISKADISRMLDVKPQYLNSILNGSRSLTDSFLDKFIELYGINQFDLYSSIQDTNNSLNPSITLRFIDKLDEKDKVIQELNSKILLMTEEITRIKRDNDFLIRQKGIDVPPAQNVGDAV